MNFPKAPDSRVDTVMQAFPVKLPSLWRLAFPAAVAGAVLGRGLRWLEGEPFSWPSTLPLMAVVAVMVLLMHKLQPTLAGPGGLKLMGFWGHRRQVRWDELASYRFARLYFLQPSIRLEGKDGRVHWIALDTHDLDGLYRLAREHGGPDGPLARALETPLYRL